MPFGGALVAWDARKNRTFDTERVSQRLDPFSFQACIPANHISVLFSSAFFLFKKSWNTAIEMSEHFVYIENQFFITS
jgi:hypothetical protein